MNRTSVGYAIACVIVPLLWGIVIVWISDRIEAAVRRRGAARGKTPEESAMPPLDYHI
jgi:hypothetical protein